MTDAEVKILASHFNLSAETESELWEQFENLGLTIAVDLNTGDIVFAQVGN